MAVRCYTRVRTRNTIQEWYETASNDARERARELRKAGYQVGVEGMGFQVTPVGLVKMTLVSITGNEEAMDACPEPAEIVPLS